MNARSRIADLDSKPKRKQVYIPGVLRSEKPLSGARAKKGSDSRNSLSDRTRVGSEAGWCKLISPAMIVGVGDGEKISSGSRGGPEREDPLGSLSLYMFTRLKVLMAEENKGLSATTTTSSVSLRVVVVVKIRNNLSRKDRTYVATLGLPSCGGGVKQR